MSDSTARWVLDPAHSEIFFKVKHMMIAHVKGSFGKFDIAVQGPDIPSASIHARIDAASVSTNEEARDKHLRSADFFDVENYPDILFDSISFKNTGSDTHELAGNLTIRGISKPIVLQVEYGGTGKDPWGNEKAAFSWQGRINRKEWGLNWNAALEAGGVLVSDEVRIEGEVQFVKQWQA